MQKIFLQLSSTAKFVTADLLQTRKQLCSSQ